MNMPRSHIPEKMPRSTAQSKNSLKSLQKTVADLETPADLFAGIVLKNHFVPDNILFFCRTHSRAFTPGGVINNYHHRFELVVVLDKAGVARVGNQSYLLQPGEAVLIFPNQFHHYMDVEDGELEWLFITFEVGDPDCIMDLKDQPRILDKNAMQWIEKAAGLFKEAQTQGRDSSLELSFELSCVLRRMLALPMISDARVNIHSTDDNRDVLLEKINETVRRNLHRSLTIEALADETGYSVSYLRAVFREKLGISLGKYIRDSRLSMAAQLLLSSDLSVTQVARKTGFDSLVTFSRAFKKSYGTSPKAYSRLAVK